MTDAEPQPGLPDESAHHSAFLDWYRATAVEKVLSLPEAERHRSRVPSGWTPEDRWRTDASVAELAALLDEQGVRTRGVLACHSLDEVARIGGRFASDPPDLRWICFHVLQEYARHAGHLDVAVELAGGPTGE